TNCASNACKEKSPTRPRAPTRSKRGISRKRCPSKSKISVSTPSTFKARCSACRRSRQRSLIALLSEAVNLTMTWPLSV
ncbi:putative lipoprotein, partial [Vibrio cholerae HC-17A1]